MPHTRTHIEHSEVDCARLSAKATLILEYQQLFDDAGSLLGKVFSEFDCRHKHKCGIGQGREVLTEEEWEACPFRHAFKRR